MALGSDFVNSQSIVWLTETAESDKGLVKQDTAYPLIYTASMSSFDLPY